ncbi:MAG: hypothetical protein JWR60_2684 [Polaromonas sp.]|nr:hypothetical protein [Polaromonas sp.]
MRTKIWSLMYRLGTTGRVIGDYSNPQSRKQALEGAAVITSNGWCVWIEHHASGKVLYRNPAEMAHQQSLADKPSSAVGAYIVPGEALQPRESEKAQA